VKYPAEAGGFTPGDTWELYLGADHRDRQSPWQRGPKEITNLLLRQYFPWFYFC